MSDAAVTLSPAQQRDLRDWGAVEKTVEAGDVLFSVGDAEYPFIALLDGFARIEDERGEKVIDHRDPGFLGEMNLLSGQTVYLTARALTDLTYLELDRHRLRELLMERPSLSDLLIGTFMQRRELLQKRGGVGPKVVGRRDDPQLRRTLDFLARSRTPYQWWEPSQPAGAELLEAHATDDQQLPLIVLPGGAVLRRPSSIALSTALGVAQRLAPVEEVDLVVLGGGPAGLGAAVYGASEGLSTLVVEGIGLGGQAGTSRRIENYLGFPAGITGNELTSRAVTQARKFGARTATPRRVHALEPGDGNGRPHVVRLDTGSDDEVEVRARAVVLATGANYRKLPVDRLEEFEGLSVFYAAGPVEAKQCAGTPVGVVGGGNSAAQAAIFLAEGGAEVHLLHRRANLAETMSDYLIRAVQSGGSRRTLESTGVHVHDRASIAELHGEDGQLSGVTLSDGQRIDLRFLFVFIGAAPCTDWLGDDIARDGDGFVLTGEPAGARGMLETSVPGIFAAGDVRSGSTKRCASAIGEGAMAVSYVHQHLAPAAA